MHLVLNHQVCAFSLQPSWETNTLRTQGLLTPLLWVLHQSLGAAAPGSSRDTQATLTATRKGSLNCRLPKNGPGFHSLTVSGSTNGGLFTCKPGRLHLLLGADVVGVNWDNTGASTQPQVWNKAGQQGGAPFPHLFSALRLPFRP